MTQFTNQVAVVTGAASGIGKAIARKLGSAGVRLILLDLYPNGTEDVTEDFREAEIVPADITVKNMAASICWSIVPASPD
jgi:NADP-dependent 3-hydroxy acid dehydrogenase YdfG